MSRATAEQTRAYARGFGASAAPGHFRSALGLTLSSLGLGTYLGRDDEAADRGYREAIGAAVAGGVNVLDTAINYRLERSERALGAALGDLAARGVPREQVVVATKGGYVPARDPERYFREEILKPGHAAATDLVAGCHCLAPGYLRHQLSRSLANLGLDAVDVYYLHNPEQQLDELERPEFLARVRAAFEALEAEAAAGRVGVYGTATWNGYRVGPERPEHLSLEELVRLARQVAGDAHHFRVVQLPFNLGMAEAYGTRSQTLSGRGVSLLEAAAELGIAVMASASILQGRLARGLPAGLAASLGSLDSDALRAIQFARSAPGVTTALVGMGRVAHVAENLGIVGVSPLEPEAIAALFSPS